MEIEHLHTRLLQAFAVKEERWEDAVDLTQQLIDDLDVTSLTILKVVKSSITKVKE